MRLIARYAANKSVAAEIQYQVEVPTARQPNNTSRGTCMPLGPPVRSDWLFKNIQIRSPSSSVATAR